MTGSTIRSRRQESGVMPDFSYEKKYWRRGYHLVIGVDEVGRGALAGSVVAAAAFTTFTHVHKYGE